LPVVLVSVHWWRAKRVQRLVPVVLVSMHSTVAQLDGTLKVELVQRVQF
jgi:hypothetical protein